MNYSIGMDIGTTTVKCELFRQDLSSAAEAFREYRTVTPRPSWAEQDPWDWWRCAVSCIREVIGKSGARAQDIKVISVSGQAPCALPVDRNGDPLCDALIWMDRRSTEEEALLRKDPGEEYVYQTTGNRLDTYFMLPKLMWLVRHRPEVMEKCCKVLQANGFINARLTGRLAIDVSHASLTGAYDHRKKEWSGRILDAAGIHRDWMPDVLECCEAVGHVCRRAAEETGLSEETVVLGGTNDASVAALEMDAAGDGKIVEMTGTSSVVMAASDHIRTAENLAWFRGHSDQVYFLFGAMNTTGGSLKWFRDNIWSEHGMAGEDPYDRMNREVEYGTGGPSGILFLPYLSGERSPIWDSDASGMMTGLNMNTDRAAFIRGIMEGSCYALQDNLKQMEAVGISADSLLCCGGCANSGIWLKIKASVIQKEILVPAKNRGAVGGLACMNAAWCGDYSTPEEAAAAGRSEVLTVEPVREWIRPYEELFGIYRDTYSSLRQIYRELARKL